MAIKSSSNYSSDLLIDGQLVPAKSGNRFDTNNPATGDVIARVAQAGPDDVNTAVAAARSAFDNTWRRMRAADRGELLYKLAQLIERDAEALTRLESLDSGKPVAAIQRQDLPATIDTLKFYAGMADKIDGHVIPARADALTYTLREPLGVVGAIIPWNFPLMIGMWKIAPALACGCTMVMKPAEVTPLSAIRIGELALEAGIPPGVLNILPGSGSTTGQAIIDHADIDKITFTGSPAVGRKILHAAAGNMKRVSLELGGKSANIIFPDADITTATKAAGAGIFFNTGQVCSAGSRILAHTDVYDEVVERLSERAQGMRMGDPLEASTRMGPIVSQKQMERVLGYIDIGRDEGAAVVAGGNRVGDTGYFVEATVFANVEHEMRISQEEIFGPVASVIRFNDEDDAVRIANGTVYSLAAGLWSNDISLAHRMTQRLNAGTVWVNTYGPTDIRLPWGGARDSGIGREHGKAAIDNYTEPKSVWINTGL